MEEYETIQGDTWDVISKKVYGDEKRLVELMRVNPAWIHTVFFPSGVLLDVPITEVEDIPSELPPWKQVNANVS